MNIIFSFKEGKVSLEAEDESANRKRNCKDVNKTEIK